MVTNIMGRRFGVEIEVERIDRERAARAVATAIGGTARYVGGSYDKWEVTAPDGRVWTAMRDGSLREPAAEVVTPILCGADDVALLQKVVRAVRAAGARVSDRCGVHVHVDAAGLDGKALGRLATIVWSRETLFRKALAIKSNRSYYCRELPTDVVERLRKARTLADANRAWYGHEYDPRANCDHYNHSRYHGLNLHSVWYRGTVEFRWFNGTTHAGQIRAYVLFVLGLVEMAATTRSARFVRKDVLSEDERHEMYWFLQIRLGFKGETAARKHLTQNLTGRITAIRPSLLAARAMLAAAQATATAAAV